MKTLVKNGVLIMPDKKIKSDLLIENEKIVEIGQNLSAENIIDATDCLVFAGFIDAHTHLDMPVSQTVTADNFETGSAAAVAGGTTMFIDFATQDRGHTLKEACEIWHKRADGNCSCDYGFHMAITDWNEQTKNELHFMKDEGITSFKCYYAYDALMLNDVQIYEILCEMEKIGGILGVHCENGPIIKKLQQNALKLGHKTPKYHAITRPDVLEGEAISRFLRIANVANAKAWIVHLSTEDGLNEIRFAKQRGQKVYTEICPQYLIFDDSVYNLENFESAKYVCSPPIRNKKNQSALWDAVIKNEIDIISTDHCSFNFKGQKELGINDFTKIPNGMAGIEHRATVIYTCAVATGKIDECQMSKMLSENPAKMFGVFPKKGVLAVGSDADIVIYDTKKSSIITCENQFQNCDYTPYEGFKTVGSIRDVFLRGNHIFKNGSLVNKNLGMYVKREKSG